MKNFCFTVDDNIRCLKEITENNYKSIFEHPYLAMYKRLHEEFDLKVQLNLFYRMNGFDLSQMSDAYYSEWEKNSDWLKLSFHSEFETAYPYSSSGYDEVYDDCRRVNEQIKRFASPSALGKTTTIHCCVATEEGLRAISDNKVLGLLGLFGSEETPRISYGIEGSPASRIRNGQSLKIGEIIYAAIDIVLNCFSIEQIEAQLEELLSHNHLRVMIHEQFFYSDYPSYQANFEEKLRATFRFLVEHGYKSNFYENMIEE